MKIIFSTIITLILINITFHNFAYSQQDDHDKTTKHQEVLRLKSVPRNNIEDLQRDMLQCMIDLGELYKSWDEVPKDVLSCITSIDHVSEQFYYQRILFDFFVSSFSSECDTNQFALYNFLTVRYCSIKSTIKKNKNIILMTLKNTEEKKVIDILEKATITISAILIELGKQQEALKKISPELIKGS